MIHHNRVLIVDDDDAYLKLMEKVLQQADLEVETHADVGAALCTIRDQAFHIIISDYRMPKTDGVEFLTRCKEIQPDAIRILLSGMSDLDGLQSAINKAEIYRFLDKNGHDVDLKSTIKQALAHHARKTENDLLANLVKTQQYRLDEQSERCKDIENQTPGITHVLRDADGAIVLDEQDQNFDISRFKYNVK